MNPALSHIHDILLGIKNDVKTEIIGQDTLIEKLLITVFSGGHALLEWVPGLGKTKTIRTLAQVLMMDTKRISFTPDLLPSDLTGNEIYRVKEWKFEVRKWPVFTNILLADEINRTPPKVQSALLEAMEEKQITIGEKTLDLPLPFIVFATQNPLEHEGTYPLPEAQLDRFLMKIVLDYPSRSDEREIFIQETWGKIFNRWHTPNGESEGDKLSESDDKQWNRWAKANEFLSPSEPFVSFQLWKEMDNFGTFGNKSTEKKINKEDILEMIDYIAKSIRVDEKIYEYVSDLLGELRKLTRTNMTSKNNENFPLLSYWPSTRAGLALIRAGRVHALLDGRDYMLPDDVKSLAHDILDHRIGLSYEAMSEWITTYSVTAKVLENVKVA
jgi:MoxR-like ATPase